MTHSPLVIKTTDDMKKWRKTLGAQSVGFVPTMGALHDGHLSLLKKCHSQNNQTVLSIFVNPTQFNQSQDLEKYPRTWENDLKLAASAGTNVIFFPSYEDIYPDGYTLSVNEIDFSTILCGASRAGHFQGVLTVVLKLINLVNPDRVYMGEKDYQQLHLIKKMVTAFFISTEIIGCPTMRDERGLALSSRNSRLSDQDKQRASLIFKSITTAKTAQNAQADLEKAGFKIDYLVDIDNRRFVAAFVPSAVSDGDVRLVDNVQL